MKVSDVVGLAEFLEKFDSLVAEMGLDVSGYNMDHVAYQASSSSGYESVVKNLSEYGELIHEPEIGGRRVAMVRLSEPINYKNNEILALEILEPREGQVCESGWEHAEYVIDESYEDLMAKYKDLDWDTSSMDRPLWSHLKLKLGDKYQVKVHKMDVLKTIELDK